MTVQLQAPKNISPLIRAGRWAFFIGGIVYGMQRLESLKKYDAPIRKAKIEELTREHEKQEAEAKVAQKESMNALARQIGVNKTV